MGNLHALYIPLLLIYHLKTAGFRGLLEMQKKMLTDGSRAPPPKAVHKTHRQLQPNLSVIWLVSPSSSSPLHLTQLRCFTVILHNETQRCGTGGKGRAGEVSAVVYGSSGLSPVKTQLIVINSRAGKWILAGKNEYILLPKGFLNFAIEEELRRRSENLQRQPTTQKSQGYLISEPTHCSGSISYVCRYIYISILLHNSYQKGTWSQRGGFFFSLLRVNRMESIQCFNVKTLGLHNIKTPWVQLQTMWQNF